MFSKVGGIQLNKQQRGHGHGREDDLTDVRTQRAEESGRVPSVPQM